jgi:hypothetical protein
VIEISLHGRLGAHLLGDHRGPCWVERGRFISHMEENVLVFVDHTERKEAPGTSWSMLTTRSRLNVVVSAIGSDIKYKVLLTYQTAGIRTVLLRARADRRV